MKTGLFQGWARRNGLKSEASDTSAREARNRPRLPFVIVQSQSDDAHDDQDDAQQS